MEEIYKINKIIMTNQDIITHAKDLSRVGTSSTHLLNLGFLQHSWSYFAYSLIPINCPIITNFRYLKEEIVFIYQHLSIYNVLYLP